MASRRASGKLVMNSGIMQNMRYQIAVIFAALLILASCAQMTPNGSDISTQAVQLTPYRTATATATITPTPPDAPTSTLAPTITPTPRVYTVKANDTLIDIAYLNGLTLDELKAANPDVNPYNLAIGTKLLIPAAKPAQSTLAVPNPTPAPIPVRAINCTPSLTGGLYCFALIENNQENDLENLTAEFRLTDPSSGEVISQSAQFPLSRLKAGTALPFYTYFSPPIAMNPNVELNILTAAAVENGKGDQMFLNIEDNQFIVAPDGLSAVFNGGATLDGEGWSAGQIVLAAVAYNAAGEVIGVRRVEVKTGLATGEEYSFETTVYSTGGKIANVMVFGEAFP